MSVDTRRSPFYTWLDHARIRELVRGALGMPAGERLVLIKGLIPGLVDEIGVAAVEAFLGELRMKSQRYAEALAHPGEGGGVRHAASEPLGGPIAHGEARLPGTRNARRPGGRALERQWEAGLWERIGAGISAEDNS